MKISGLFLNSRNGDGNTALHLLVANNKIDGKLKESYIEYLLEEGIDVKILNNNGFKAIDLINSENPLYSMLQNLESVYNMVFLFWIFICRFNQEMNRTANQVINIIGLK